MATRTPEPGNVDAILELVDDILLASEEEMIAAIHSLYASEGVIAEPSGAASTAAFLKQPHRSGPVVLLITGANIADDIRARAGLPKEPCAHSQTAS